MIKSYSRILNEGFNSYFKRLEESVQTIYDEYRNITKEPIIEFPNGEYFYVVVDPETRTMYAGGATNTGVFREYEIDIDEDGTLDSNLEALYDYMIEENPELTYDVEDIENTNRYYDELMGESLDDEYKTIAKLSGGLELIKYPYGYAISDGYTNDRLTVTDNGFQVDDGRFNLSNKDKNIINNCIKNGELTESYTKKELLDAVKDAYGFTNKEANEWIKKASDKSKEEIVKGFKDNARRSFLTDSLKESSDDGNIGKSIKKKVKDLYNQEISKDDKEHSIDKDGYGFTIIRKNGKKLVYDGSKGKFVNSVNESKNSKRLSESMEDANKAEIELYNFLDKWVKKYSEFLDMETLSDIYYSAIDTEF